MTSKSQPWGFIQTKFPELASYVEARFDAHEHHVVATVRADGRPRVSGTNVMFTDGTLWIGMMPAALRAHDLRRSPFCALHSAPLNENLPDGEGDVRINAEVRELNHPEVQKLFGATSADGTEIMPGSFFELLPTEISTVEVDNDAIVLTRWTDATGVVTSRHQ